MIIGFDGSRAFLTLRTGTENYAYQLLRALSKIDKKNNYVIFIKSGTEIDNNWPDNFSFKIINWPRLWTQGGLALKTFSEKLDVLFVPAHTLPIIRKSGLKTVVTVHDLGSEYLPQMHQLKQRLYLALMQRYQLKTASKIIAVSKATKDDLIKKIGIKSENVTVVYEGYNKDIYRPIPQSPKSYFLFVGTVQPRKNLKRIIEAVTKLGEKLIIVGAKGWLSDPIYKMAGSNIKFLGRVSDQELAKLYKRAKALLFPSLFEGFGLPILEAQACGCPVITSNISSMPEIAGKGAVFVDPYSVDDIVRGMERLQVTGNRQQLVNAGFENIKRFSWEKCAIETIKVLESL